MEGLCPRGSGVQRRRVLRDFCVRRTAGRPFFVIFNNAMFGPAGDCPRRHSRGEYKRPYFVGAFVRVVPIGGSPPPSPRGGPLPLERAAAHAARLERAMVASGARRLGELDEPVVPGYVLGPSLRARLSSLAARCALRGRWFRRTRRTLGSTRDLAVLVPDDRHDGGIPTSTDVKPQSCLRWFPSARIRRPHWRSRHAVADQPIKATTTAAIWAMAASASAAVRFPTSDPSLRRGELGGRPRKPTKRWRGSR
jgi:hypothetical protein